MQWQGPYEVIEKLGDVDYRIRVPSLGIRLYHVNLLKAWQKPEEPEWYQAEIDWDDEGQERSKELRKVATGFPTSDWQLYQIQQVIGEYPEVFWEVPGHGHGIVQRIPKPPGQVVRVSFRPMPLSGKYKRC